MNSTEFRTADSAATNGYTMEDAMERYYVLIETWRKQQQQFAYATEAEALARYGQSARTGDNRGDVWDFSYTPPRHLAHYVRD